mmetsp:Transcript_5068/g.8205  ORF Transcript_5068/g.8205 Transcript_5068/m.8205 type:complete len:281 (-) Transcript_5068:1257-2099(-)
MCDRLFASIARRYCLVQHHQRALYLQQHQLIYQEQSIVVDQLVPQWHQHEPSRHRSPQHRHPARQQTQTRRISLLSPVLSPISSRRHQRAACHSPTNVRAMLQVPMLANDEDSAPVEPCLAWSQAGHAALVLVDRRVIVALGSICSCLVDLELIDRWPTMLLEHLHLHSIVVVVHSKLNYYYYHSKCPNHRQHQLLLLRRVDRIHSRPQEAQHRHSSSHHARHHHSCRRLRRRPLDLAVRHHCCRQHAHPSRPYDVQDLSQHRRRCCLLLLLLLLRCPTP